MHLRLHKPQDWKAKTPHPAATPDFALKSQAASQSFAEANRGFQAIAAEMTNYSKKSIEDVIKAWEQLSSARSLPEMIDIQTRYATKAYETYMSSLSEIADGYLDLARQTTRPVEQTVRK